MAINLTTLSNKAAHVNIEWMGQTCRVTYDPTIVTAAWLTKSKASDEAFVEAFAELVKSWDVKYDAKRVVPLTMEGLFAVPMPLLQAIYQRLVFGEIADIEEEGKDSNDG